MCFHSTMRSFPSLSECSVSLHHLPWLILFSDKYILCYGHECVFPALCWWDSQVLLQFHDLTGILFYAMSRYFLATSVGFQSSIAQGSHNKIKSSICSKNKYPTNYFIWWVQKPRAKGNKGYNDYTSSLFQTPPFYFSWRALLKRNTSKFFPNN